ncbi:hypothetical protein ACIQ7N_19300 [Lysinibacillus sp. NPDC095746]|uniref:hypothetical protein n=1 Tax=Lysinibacillus sp. NPDC095746 TaxID=3364134 RepID=UPI0037F4000D
MKKFFPSTVVFTFILTIVAMILTNKYSLNFKDSVDLMPGGNGNAALIFIFMFSPFILYFFISMTIIFNSIYMKSGINKYLFRYSSIFLFFILLTVTVVRILNFHSNIKDNYDYELNYLNTFSNHLFFNWYTFLLILCLSAIISTFYKKKPGL